MVLICAHFLLNLAVGLVASWVTLMVCKWRFHGKGRCPACGSRNYYLGYEERGPGHGG